VTTSTSYADLARLALEVATEAGEIAREGFRTRPRATEKGLHDLVTEFDLRSEEHIRSRLSAATPDMALVVEEGGGAASATSTWYCDPLDGTTNFVHGHPFWSVSIGVLELGVPVVGAVVAPCLGLWWTGYRGGSATRGRLGEAHGERCRVSQTRNLDDALLATGFPPNRQREPDNNLATFVDVMHYVRGIRRCGSAAVDLCFVGDGTYDGYWERRLNAWDLTAGAAVVSSAGGRLSSLSGGPADLTQGDLLASNGLIHDAMVDLLRLHA